MVFNAWSLFDRLGDIAVEGLSQHMWDMVASVVDICLYISDSENRCIWRVKVNGDREHS